MEEYATLQHMRKAEPLDSGKLHYYIPHHAVSIDRKFRVVFDGSAKSTNGNSLNDIQYIGPRLQKDLLDIILKFRTGRIAFTADICKMFRQIEIQPEHWDLQRILWRKNTNEPILDYWLTVVTYGLASSPYNAVKALNQTALDNIDKFPMAAQVVLNDFYMDDMLTSVDSQNQAITLKGEVIALLRKGGFELAKWRSNLREIMEEDMEVKSVDEQSSTSILGVLWNFRNDKFQFKVKPRVQPEVITKRIITSEAARIFDPQGYMSPVTIRAKLFIQELWRSGKDWDNPLSGNIQQEWKEFYDELKLIEQIQIPRWIGTSKNQKCQIHVFADASKKAYGVAVYVRTITNGSYCAKLLFSRSRVTPIKIVTIPRLELCAVELSCKIITKIKRIPAFEEAPIFVWTDSEIVLYWLRKPLKELKIFVANRVNRILSSVTIEQVRHIRTEHNPANLISRGIKTERLINNSLWWNGPSMLSESNDDWPVWKSKKLDKDINDQIISECLEPIVRFDNVLLSSYTSSNQEIELITKMSSYRSVCRITAYVIRFCQSCYKSIGKRKNKSVALFSIYDNHQLSFSRSNVVIQINKKKLELPQLTIREMDNALNYWIKMSQKESFPLEYQDISKHKTISKNSRLWSLTPWIDRNGLLRIYGRLNNLDLSVNKRKPIILDHKGTLTRRLSEEAHLFLCHGGVQLCTQFLRNKYWILNIRVLVRSVVGSCVLCCRHRQESSKQFMADLPAIRLQTTPAFYHCGVDYAGPIQIKQNRNTTPKGYIAVFVCMVYKVIHLELVSSLDSDAFLATLLAKIAACLNSRPLTPISNDPTDLSTLTTGHFIIGQPILTPYEARLTDKDINRLTIWQKIQKLQQEFWSRWSQEYITEQQGRNKWAGCYRSFRIGDLVFVKNELTPPSQWLMARVVEVYSGTDGRVRSCKIKTEKGEFDRPITQLCLLPIDKSDDMASDAGFP